MKNPPASIGSHSLCYSCTPCHTYKILSRVLPKCMLSSCCCCLWYLPFCTPAHTMQQLLLNTITVKPHLMLNCTAYLDTRHLASCAVSSCCFLSLTTQTSLGTAQPVGRMNLRSKGTPTYQRFSFTRGRTGAGAARAVLDHPGQVAAGLDLQLQAQQCDCNALALEFVASDAADMR